MPGHHGGGGGGGGGGGHEGMDHGGGAMECSMSMVWNYATDGMCVVFPSWHVKGKQSFVLTLVALFLLAAVLENLRFRIRKFDVQLISTHRLTNNVMASLTGGGANSHRRKASVQHVLGQSAGKTSGIGTATLGDRRGSRLYDAFVPSLLISRRGQIHRVILYVLTLTLSMFLMLVFMTYNAWLIAAVLLGAGAGHYLFNRDMGHGGLDNDKSWCH
ncbi:Ctr copper transporter [Meira miltonrushii]|uniref:Copper transport protein n=1 Tax=Meira miltonrushii TaxID=1280837 RepID=A0A316V3U0_9BASI|nr:Ctr copper transporter [Meira miltonrushii]PWN32200.1 Ctr copper transporter [Meira miltonrushii]